MRVSITNASGGNILEYLRDNNIYIPAVCGGRGTCGRCKVRVGGHEALACETPAVNGFDIEIDTPDENEFSVLDMYTPQREPVESGGGLSGYGVAADIGTTTLAFELLELSAGRRVRAHSAINRQRALGADVITRIESAIDGKLSELRRLIVEDLSKSIKKMLSGVSSHVTIDKIALTGNTTMLHLLRGYPCDTLGRYPFVPHSLATEKHLRNGGRTSVVILPGISAFVGADVAAGILFCGLPETGFDLLIDLGTNGEMALFSKEKIFSTSAAAGPAFEAANISCGTGSVPGAVAKITYLPASRVYSYETIAGYPPIGLCGTGVVDAAAELAAYGIIDETGLLTDEFFESGVRLAPGVVFTQKDVREVQLAKSAVRAGIEILLSEAGIKYGAVRRVYIAGGFGHKININSAAAIGIIPRELKSRVRAVGNSALGGAARMLLSEAAEGEIQEIAAKAQDINLSSHPQFNDLFMKYMKF